MPRVIGQVPVLPLCLCQMDDGSVPVPALHRYLSLRTVKAQVPQHQSTPVSCFEIT